MPHFSYCAISRYINPQRLTRRILRLLLRIAHYLVDTIHLHLHLAAPAQLADASGTLHLDLFDLYTDSSHGNAEEGRGYGGFLLMTKPRPHPHPPTGAVGWKTLLPPEGYDSTGAAELCTGSLALKWALAVRTLQHELDLGVSPALPTRMFTDSKTMIDGTDCSRLIRSSRWLAAKYAMLRWGLACGTITLDKVAAEFNVADIMTKPITGRRFFALRARVLGLPDTPIGLEDVDP